MLYFLFGKFGFPQVRLAGIGYGLVVSYSLMAIYSICYLCFSKKFKPYHLFKQWLVIENKFFLEMIKVGLPMGVMLGSELGFFAVVAIMMGNLGTNVLAAYQIAHQYLTITLFIIFGLLQAVAVRVGNEVGRNDSAKIKLTIVVNMVIGLGLMLVFSVFYFAFPQVALV